MELGAAMAQERAVARTVAEGEAGTMGAEMLGEAAKVAGARVGMAVVVVMARERMEEAMMEALERVGCWAVARKVTAAEVAAAVLEVVAALEGDAEVEQKAKADSWETPLALTAVGEVEALGEDSTVVAAMVAKRAMAAKGEGLQGGAQVARLAAVETQGVVPVEVDRMEARVEVEARVVEEEAGAEVRAVMWAPAKVEAERVEVRAEVAGADLAVRRAAASPEVWKVEVLAAVRSTQDSPSMMQRLCTCSPSPLCGKHTRTCMGLEGPLAAGSAVVPRGVRAVTEAPRVAVETVEASEGATRGAVAKGSEATEVVAMEAAEMVASVAMVEVVADEVAV